MTVLFPIAAMPSFHIETGQREFQFSDPSGDYVKFYGTLPKEITPNEDGTADVCLSDVEIFERGNYLTGNSADELPQVSI